MHVFDVLRELVFAAKVEGPLPDLEILRGVVPPDWLDDVCSVVGLTQPVTSVRSVADRRRVSRPAVELHRTRYRRARERLGLPWEPPIPRPSVPRVPKPPSVKASTRPRRMPGQPTPRDALRALGGVAGAEAIARYTAARGQPLTVRQVRDSFKHTPHVRKLGAGYFGDESSTCPLVADFVAAILRKEKCLTRSEIVAKVLAAYPHGSDFAVQAWLGQAR